VAGRGHGRLARAVAPGATQRGNRRQRTFFGADDDALYETLLAEHCGRLGVEVWAWCLMPNHVHLVLVPPEAGALAAALGEAHRRYSRHVNVREGWRGYLWQGRFASCALDEPHLLAAVRYVELNPVRARLRGGDGGDGLPTTAPSPLAALVADRAAFLRETPPARALEALRTAARTGSRPLGSPAFVAALEARLGRRLRPGRPGPRRGGVGTEGRSRVVSATDACPRPTAPD
jgi:putative transposase